MSAILVGWYLPVFVLMIRDPLIREIMKDACVTGSIATAKGIATFVRWGGVTLFGTCAGLAAYGVGYLASEVEK